jgi:hypothetical protein
LLNSSARFETNYLAGYSHDHAPDHGQMMPGFYATAVTSCYNYFLAIHLKTW